MIVYGILVISSVDNLIRPYIISRGAVLPFIVMFIGVVGGIVTFGFIGIFLGPTLLTVGYSLAKEILSHPRNNHSRKSTDKSEKAASIPEPSAAATVPQPQQPDVSEPSVPPSQDKKASV